MHISSGLMGYEYQQTGNIYSNLLAFALVELGGKNSKMLAEHNCALPSPASLV